MILCLIGYSSSGKSTIAKHLRERYHIPQLKSHTTRPKRGDSDNEMFFVNDEEFETIELLECTEVSGYKYGLSKKEFEYGLEMLSSIVITYNGYEQLCDLGYYDSLVPIFVNTNHDIIENRNIESGKNRNLKEEIKLWNLENKDFFFEVNGEDIVENINRIMFHISLRDKNELGIIPALVHKTIKSTWYTKMDSKNIHRSIIQMDLLMRSTANKYFSYNPKIIPTIQIAKIGSTNIISCKWIGQYNVTCEVIIDCLTYRVYYSARNGKDMGYTIKNYQNAKRCEETSQFATYLTREIDKWIRGDVL
jgi:guanylate kinase